MSGGFRICRSCREERASGQFRRDIRTRDGLARDCITCAEAEIAGKWAASIEKELSADPSLATATRTCPKCSESKPLISFTANKNGRNGRNTHCRACQASKMRDWRARNADHIQKQQRKDWLNRKYGISLAEYDEILGAQGGRCAICREEGSVLRDGSTRLAVDHDHATGRVRGILCLSCNQAIALLEQYDHWIENALTYLAFRTS